MEKTVVELFAGVGGFRCGLNKVTFKNNKVKENGNWKFLWANQWEPATKTQEAFDCYIKRFGLKDASNIDIFKVSKKNLPNHTLLVGGFPCQDYSVARSLTNSKGIEGKKGVLWWPIADIIKAKNPPFVLLENVDRLIISPANQRGRDFGIILRSFLDNNYAVEWRVINAGEYGLQQKRRRVFIFAYHKDTKYYQSLEKKSSKEIIFEKGVFCKQFQIKPIEIKQTISNITKNNFADLVELSNKFTTNFYNAGVMIKGDIYTAKVESNCETILPLKKMIQKANVDEKYFLNSDKIEKFKYLKGGKRIPRIKPNGDPYTYSEGAMQFPDNLELPARTILTSEGGLNRMTHVIKDFKTGKLRLLTPIECERIDGFPDNWTNTGMSDRKRNFMMGNALVVQIIEKIGIEIEKIIDLEN